MNKDLADLSKLRELCRQQTGEGGADQRGLHPPLGHEAGEEVHVVRVPVQPRHPRQGPRANVRLLAPAGEGLEAAQLAVHVVAGEAVVPPALDVERHQVEAGELLPPPLEQVVGDLGGEHLVHAAHGHGEQPPGQLLHQPGLPLEGVRVVEVVPQRDLAQLLAGGRGVDGVASRNLRCDGLELGLGQEHHLRLDHAVPEPEGGGGKLVEHSCAAIIPVKYLLWRKYLKYLMLV